LPDLKKDSYVYIIGGKAPHKNINKAKEILELYNKKHKTDYVPFIISGKFNDKEIAGLYKNAKFSMFLSDIEGFGLPLIESYNQDTPVVFNNKTSLKEVGKGLPGQCNVDDEVSVFGAIDKILKMRRSEIIGLKNKLNKKYNWDKFDRVILEELLQE